MKKEKSMELQLQDATKQLYLGNPSSLDADLATLLSLKSRLAHPASKHK